MDLGEQAGQAMSERDGRAKGIVMATAVGLFFFSDFPDGWTWTGIAVIVDSGIYMSWRKRSLNTR